MEVVKPLNHTANVKACPGRKVDEKHSENPNEKLNETFNEKLNENLSELTLDRPCGRSLEPSPTVLLPDKAPGEGEDGPLSGKKSNVTKVTV